MEEFVRYVEGSAPEQIEELFTATFDLNPSCCPYLGYQLLGADPKRADLLARLQESYRALDFEAGNELPDHVAVLLRFLARLDDADLAADLVEDLLQPGLAKMVEAMDEKNPYRNLVLSAECWVLGAEYSC